MQKIDNNRLEALKSQNKDFTLVDVLGKESFDDYHIPGAVNVPLSENFSQTIETTVPNKDSTVVLYCKDEDCDASPKAAKKMEDLGYKNVYDLPKGKVGWKEAGYPVE
jgi:rhodanese-related sulfurtransferase